jgi:hypothetical protein
MQKRIAIFVHGYNVVNPRRSVGLLARYFKELGYLTDRFDYGHTRLYQVWLRNKSLARKLARLVSVYKKDGYEVTVVCHSNGASITHLASKLYDADIDYIVALQPALQRNTNPCPTAALVQIYYNADDLAVRASRWLRMITIWAKESRPWGEMGRYGYLGDDDKNIAMFDAKYDFDIPGCGHSYFIDSKKIEYFGPLIAKLADTHAWAYLPGTGK